MIHIWEKNGLEMSEIHDPKAKVYVGMFHGFFFVSKYPIIKINSKLGWSGPNWGRKRWVCEGNSRVCKIKILKKPHQIKMKSLTLPSTLILMTYNKLNDWKTFS